MWRKFMLIAALGVALLPVLANRGSAQSLQVGDLAPDFEVADDLGRAWKSEDHFGQRVLIVFFYPSDFSFCCTRQVELYRQTQQELATLDADVVGISCDSVESHKLFKAAHALNYPLLADLDGSVARKFGVPLRVGGKSMAHDESGKTLTSETGDVQQFSRDWTAARCTFVIGKDGRVLHRESRVSPISDAKTIAELVCKLTAK
jgi:peroxiredoxin Q/BCP